MVLRTRQSLSPRSSNMSGSERSSADCATSAAAFCRASGSAERACSMICASTVISLRACPQPRQLFPLHLDELLQGLGVNLGVAANGHGHARVVVMAAFIDLLAEDLEEVVVADAPFDLVDVVDDDVGEDEPGQATRFVVF